MNYYAIYYSDDGLCIKAFDKLENAQLPSGLTFINPIDFMDIECEEEGVFKYLSQSRLSGKILIIKGNIIIPKPLQIVQRWTE